MCWQRLRIKCRFLLLTSTALLVSMTHEKHQKMLISCSLLLSERLICLLISRSHSSFLHQNFHESATSPDGRRDVKDQYYQMAHPPHLREIACKQPGAGATPGTSPWS